MHTPLYHNPDNNPTPKYLLSPPNFTTLSSHSYYLALFPYLS